MDDGELGRRIATIATWSDSDGFAEPRSIVEAPSERPGRWWLRACALTGVTAVIALGGAAVLQRTGEESTVDAGPTTEVHEDDPSIETAQSRASSEPGVMPFPEKSPTAGQWPTDVQRQSALEAAIGVPGSSAGAFAEYLSRAERLVTWCMADGGFDFHDGDEVVDLAAVERLTVAVNVDGEAVSGGCRRWSEQLAFPGNYFGATYRRIDQEALAHPGYLKVHEVYDACLIGAGFPTIPDATGLSETDAEALFDEYSNAALACDAEAGLADSKRALEIFLGDALVERHPALVSAYVAELARYGIGSSDEGE